MPIEERARISGGNRCVAVDRCKKVFRHATRCGREATGQRGPADTKEIDRAHCYFIFDWETGKIAQSYKWDHRG